MAQQIVTVVGGTGFVGRYVVKLLAAAGYTVRVISRHPDAALHLKTSGHAGPIVLMGGDLARPDSLEGKLDQSWAVINLVGVLFEAGRQSFSRVHAHGAERLAQLARTAGAERFVHVSALGVSKASGSAYARSKLLGEKAVLAAFPEASILRPGVIFGAEDHFFNRFAAMASVSPILPLIGGGKTRFQPVYAGDVAHAVMACLTRHGTAGNTYELGGPRIYTFREILEYILRLTGKRRMLIPIPFGLASLMGACAGLLPNPPLTRDQVKLLRQDNVVGENALTLAHLGLNATAAEIVVPEYLSLFRRKPL
ncbi:MAG: complex I NDUFA9 subunit family protein [Pseudomonadota bacterium]|nr:complex I NDUFA9 subunit family protein [Pseudomonadota bacterium]